MLIRTFIIGLQIILFLLLLIVSDKIIGTALRMLYFNQKSGPSYSLTYSVRECKADILILGASQAQHNYDPRILSDSLNMKCYNGGQDGGHSILFQYAQIIMLTQFYSPQVIILEFNPRSIQFNQESYEKLSVLLAYYKDYPDIRSIIHMRGPFERIKLKSDIYPFNSSLINIIRYNTDTYAARKKDFDGYIPIKNRIMNSTSILPEEDQISEIIVDTNKINALKGIIDICNKKHIKLIVVSSPIFHNQAQQISSTFTFESKIYEIFKMNDVNYIDFSHDKLLTENNELFADKMHLNEMGSVLFSVRLVGCLKSIINYQEPK